MTDPAAERFEPSTPPPGVLLLQMISGRWLSQAIAAAAELGLADAVAEGPARPAEIANRIGADAATTYRLLRMLASFGIFAEDERGRFQQTPMSELLREAVPGSLRGMAMYLGSRASLLAWADLATSVRTGEGAFRRVHGKSFFEHLGESPAEARAFDHAMHGVSSTEIPALLAAYDFADCGRIVDVGGGDGTLLAAILTRHPAPSGVLYDLAHVVEAARARIAGSPLAGRIEIATGSFFEAVPSGGDTYLLKHILHDWDDARCREILDQVRRAMAAHGRLLIVESVILPGNAPHFGKLLDIEMLALTEGGRERSEAEFVEVLRGSGFRLSRIVPTQAPTSVVEARPV